MKKRIFCRVLALVLALGLTLPTAAGALTLEQARELLQKYYIEEVPDQVLSQPTIQDMLRALGDPYTVYFTPEEYAAFNAVMRDSSIVGIGVSVTMTEDGVKVEFVYEDSPAMEGGLQKGDYITAIDGKSTIGASLDTAGEWLRGEAGTPVTVTYLRDGVSRTIALTRRQVIIPATTTQVEEGHIGLIKCTTFGGETLGHFVDGITAAQGTADRWIVDLRSNSGGVLDAAIQSVGLFTGGGVVAYLRDGTGRHSAFGANREAMTSEPVIVLTDAGTASASELFAAANRDRKAGINVGVRTYGKGVAQGVFDQTLLPSYFPDGDAIKITAYRFYAPGGSTTDAVGVIPHLLVPADSADEVARLLCASDPGGDTAGMLRLDMGWHWYIDLDMALREENRDALALLLEAIPVNARLLMGTGGADGWQDTTPDAVARAHGLTLRDRGFTDTADSPYAQSIDILATYGVMNGMGGGRFRPEDTMTRAQLCAMLYQALAYDTPIQESRYTDVPLDAWYGQQVNAMAQLGLVNGMGGGYFHPDDPVTHEQFIAIMGRLAAYLNLYMDLKALRMPAAATGAEELTGYAHWARDEVWLLALSQQDISGDTINLLWAAPEEIDPTAATTRGEAARLVYTLLSYTGVLPA